MPPKNAREEAKVRILSDRRSDVASRFFLLSLPTLISLLLGPDTILLMGLDVNRMRSNCLVHRSLGRDHMEGKATVVQTGT